MVRKYNIYIICKNEDIFNSKVRKLSKYKSKICHIQWIPAEYLKLTMCNKKILTKLKTMYNTKQKNVIAKLGCIAAHRKALLAIYSNQTDHNLILEEDHELQEGLPLPPEESCYMGGWIIPPKISRTNKEKIVLNPKRGLNKINYSKFKIITTHALYIRTNEEAVEILDKTIEPEKIKNYDVFLADLKIFNNFYYPSIFVQGKHKSEITGTVNKNYIYTMNYGLNNPVKKSKPKKTKKKKNYKLKKTKSK